jgi:hypothetical protein
MREVLIVDENNTVPFYVIHLMKYKCISWKLFSWLTRKVLAHADDATAPHI